jgi:hypothetical protein
MMKTLKWHQLKFRKTLAIISAGNELEKEQEVQALECIWVEEFLRDKWMGDKVATIIIRASFSILRPVKILK